MFEMVIPITDINDSTPITLRNIRLKIPSLKKCFILNLICCI